MLVAKFRFMFMPRWLYRDGCQWTVQCAQGIPRGRWVGADAAGCMAALYAADDVHDFQLVSPCARRHHARPA